MCYNANVKNNVDNFKSRQGFYLNQKLIDLQIWIQASNTVTRLMKYSEYARGHFYGLGLCHGQVFLLCVDCGSSLGKPSNKVKQLSNHPCPSPLRVQIIKYNFSTFLGPIKTVFSKTSPQSHLKTT